MYDASNRKNIRQAEKQAALAENNRIAYTRQIMGTLGGREWMHDLLVRCYVFHEPFVPGRPDATGYNLGRAGIGRQLFADVTTHCPSEYALMMQEASIKELANDRRNSDNAATGAEPTGESRPGTTAQPNRRNPSAGFETTADGFVIDNSADDYEVPADLDGGPSLN